MSKDAILEANVTKLFSFVNQNESSALNLFSNLKLPFYRIFKLILFAKIDQCFSAKTVQLNDLLHKAKGFEKMLSM